MAVSSVGHGRSNNQSRCKKIPHYKNAFLDTTKIKAIIKTDCKGTTTYRELKFHTSKDIYKYKTI